MDFSPVAPDSVSFGWKFKQIARHGSGSYGPACAEQQKKLLHTRSVLGGCTQYLARLGLGHRELLLLSFKGCRVTCSQRNGAGNADFLRHMTPSRCTASLVLHVHAWTLEFVLKIWRYWHIELWARYNVQ